MNEREESRKELKYIPIRNVKMPRYEEKEGRERRERRVERREKPKRKIKGIAAYIGTMTLIGATLVAIVPGEVKKQQQKYIEQVKEIKGLNHTKSWEERAEKEISEIEQEINDIEPTTEEIKKNIIEQYLAEYNREHNTNIENCELISSVQNYVFVTADNQYVTHGDHPQEVMDFLTNNGIDYRATGEDTKVYYSYADGVTLEMMTKGENKELVDVTSGQNIQKLNDKSYNNTLIEMADVLEIGSEWAKDPENEELKEAYIQALEEHKEKKEEKEVETASKTENTNNIKTASMDEVER